MARNTKGGTRRAAAKGKAAAPTTTTTLPAEAPGQTGSPPIRVDVTIEGETTEYEVQPVPVDRGDTRWNVVPAHDPAGKYLLEEPAETVDDAIAQFTGRFDSDQVSISGGGTCYALVQGEQVVGVVDELGAANAEAKRINGASGEEGKAPTVGAVVHPATAAVKAMFEATGPEGVRFRLDRSGLVTLAR